MIFTKEERVFEIIRKNSYVKFTVKDNKLKSLVIIEGEKCYAIFSNGFWHYYDSKKNVDIMPKSKGMFLIKGDNESVLKSYCKAYVVENKCENFWKEALLFIKQTRIIL